MIEKEDWEEPICLLLDDEGNPRCTEHININAVISKLDSLYNKEEYSKAKNVILYWLKESEILKDRRAMFTMYDEGIGLARKTGDKEWGIMCIEGAFLIAKDEDIIDRISAGTAYLNGATTLKAFGQLDRALTYFELAYKIYSENLEKKDYRFSSLYNNYALALTEKGELKRAEGMLFEAISCLDDKYLLEKAISYTNLSDLYYKAELLDNCDKYLKEAFEIISNYEGERDGYFAFVSKKCASAFAYHGFFKEEQQLLKWAKEIYERN